MKQSTYVITLCTISIAASVVAGAAIYVWMGKSSEIKCIETVYSFGCTTHLGWILTAAGGVLFGCAVAAWEYFRGD